MKYSHDGLKYKQLSFTALTLKLLVLFRVGIKKKILFREKNADNLNFNVLRHRLQNFVLSLFNFTHLTLDR